MEHTTVTVTEVKDVDHNQPVEQVSIAIFTDTIPRSRSRSSTMASDYVNAEEMDRMMRIKQIKASIWTALIVIGSLIGGACLVFLLIKAVW